MDLEDRRKRTRANSGDDNKKQRGRPRLEPQDETAADRRRTQIRLAQRAYRLRKETTIQSLKKRVNELQETIDEMNKSFLRFNDNAMSSGIMQLKPELARELKGTTEQFINLARHAATETDDDLDDDENPSVDRTTPDENQTVSSRRAETERTQSQTTVSQTTLDIGWGYTQTFETPEASTESFYPVETLEPATQTIQRFQRTANGHNPYRNTYQSMQYRLHIPDMDDHTRIFSATTGKASPVSLPLPYTYSFQEKTFARRLHRASLEAGFHLISQAHLRPAVFKRVFKLSLMYGTRGQIQNRFKSLLTKTIDDPLEFWQTPFINLGGAGTHYPVRDEHGNIIPRPNSYRVQAIGDGSVARLVHSDEAGASPEALIDMSGYEGEWFDAYDVEGYLAEKGIRINPQASFAEAEIIDMAPNANLNTSSPANSGDWSTSAGTVVGMEESPIHSPPPLSPPSRTLPEENLDKNWMQGPLYEPTIASSWMGLTPSLNDEVPTTAMDGLNGLTGSAFNTDSNPGMDLLPFNDTQTGAVMPGFEGPVAFDNTTTNLLAGAATYANTGVFAPQKSSFHMYEKRTVTIDVTKMIEELLVNAVCLGGAPGYRRKDVDRALTASMISLSLGPKQLQ